MLNALRNGLAICEKPPTERVWFGCVCKCQMRRGGMILSYVLYKPAAPGLRTVKPPLSRGGRVASNQYQSNEKQVLPRSNSTNALLRKGLANNATS